MSFSRRSILLGSASLLFAPAVFAADPGVASDKIVFGQVAALEGPASALGLGMREGLRAAFAEINEKAFGRLPQPPEPEVEPFSYAPSLLELQLRAGLATMESPTRSCST